MNVEQVPRKYRMKKNRLLFHKAKLKAISRTSALLCGFTMIAMVEISLDDHEQSESSIPLIIIYSILTCLVVGVHLLALMISTCILSVLESNILFDHKTMQIYIQFAWILSSGVGIFLFLLEILIVCWVKFFFITHSAAIATTVILVPTIILFCIFSLHFYRRRVISKLSQHQNELNQIEDRLTVVAFPLVNIV